MTDTGRSRLNRASINLPMGVIGLAALLTVVIATAVDAPGGINVVAVLSLLVSLAVMFVTRKSDEYTLGLWSSGANAAFAVIVLWFLFTPFFEGVYDGYTRAQSGTESVQDFPTEGGSIAALFAFYVVFNFKRLTGAL